MIATRPHDCSVLVNASPQEEPPIPSVIFASKSRDGKCGVLEYSDGTSKEVDLWA